MNVRDELLPSSAAMFAYRLSPDLSLELLEPRHAAELHRLTDDNREHLRTWLPWLDRIRSVDDTTAFIDVTRRQLAENRGFQTVIRWHGNLVGIIGQHGVDWSSRSTSLGYWLARDAQGHGIMTRSCRVYLAHAFDDLRLHRVEIRCAMENKKSRAIPERLGFRKEGVVRDAEWLYDHFVDHVVYGLLESEWRKAQ
jgi:ribosomal-protein-serine acetyltransferase